MLFEHLTSVDALFLHLFHVRWQCLSSAESYNYNCSFFNIVIWDDQAVDISLTEYELSDMDILYADGITSSDGLASTDFSFPQLALDGRGFDEPDPQDTLLRSVLKSLKRAW